VAKLRERGADPGKCTKDVPAHALALALPVCPVLSGEWLKVEWGFDLDMPVAGAFTLHDVSPSALQQASGMAGLLQSAAAAAAAAAAAVAAAEAAASEAAASASSPSTDASSAPASSSSAATSSAATAASSSSASSSSSSSSSSLCRPLTLLAIAAGAGTQFGDAAVGALLAHAEDVKLDIVDEKRPLHALEAAIASGTLGQTRGNHSHQ
jgi:hypothetical protein